MSSGMDFGHLGQDDLIDLVFGDAGLGIRYRRTVAQHRPGRDQPGKVGARQGRVLWHIAGKRLIKPGRRICGDPDEKAAFRHDGYSKN